jgi:cell division protease FtsH
MPPKNKKDFSWGRFSKTLSFWILILLVPVALIQLSSARSEQAPKINYTRYRAVLEKNNVMVVIIQAGMVGRGEFRETIAVDASGNACGPPPGVLVSGACQRRRTMRRRSS